MPSTSNILERLRWKVGLGLVIVASGFAAGAVPSADNGADVARSSWGFSSQSQSEAQAVESDVARSSWGFARSSSSASDADVQADAVVDAA